MIDALGAPQKVLLLGGTSEIGLAVVSRLSAGRSCTVVLAGRPGPRLEEAAGGLRSHGHQVEVVPFDALDAGSYGQAVETAFAGGAVDVAVVAFGVLGDAEQVWQDATAAHELMTVNYTAPVQLGILVAQRMRQRGRGALIVLSSVAGERPRRSNFGYGSTKAGLDAFFTGLREALRPDGVRVLVVRPGFVRSRMTEGLDPAPLATTPEVVAEAAVKGLVAGRDTVWVPAPLRFVMSVLRHVPAPVFRRLPL